MVFGQGCRSLNIPVTSLPLKSTSSIWSPTSPDVSTESAFCSVMLACGFQPNQGFPSLLPEGELILKGGGKAIACIPQMLLRKGFRVETTQPSPSSHRKTWYNPCLNWDQKWILHLFVNLHPSPLKLLGIYQIFLFLPSRSKLCKVCWKHLPFLLEGWSCQEPFHWGNRKWMKCRKSTARMRAEGWTWCREGQIPYPQPQKRSAASDKRTDSLLSKEEVHKDTVTKIGCMAHAQGYLFTALYGITKD